MVGTDDQALSLSGNTLTLEDGGTVDLTPYLDNTDDQQITDFSLSGNIVTLTLEDGGTQTVDLSGFVSTDDQALSLSGNTLTLEDGGTVDLTPYLDNTDDQQITDFSLSGNIVTLTLEDGGTQTIDLTGFVSTDDQNLTLTGNTLEIEDGNTVDLSGYLDNTDDQNLTGATLTGTDLQIDIENGGSANVDLSSLVGTDDQNITGSILSGTDLTIGIENGTNQTIDLSSLVDDADADPSNEIQDLSLSGNTLSLSGDASSVDLTTYLDNTDAQTLSITGDQLSIANGNTVTVPTADGSETEVTEGESMWYRVVVPQGIHMW